MNKKAFSGRFALISAITALALIVPSIFAQTANRSRTEFFGSSGGNILDRTNAFCCSGTLGSLVLDSTGVRHILSNNHVLARSDAASLGEDISQPGLIDVGCNVNQTTIVGDLSAFPRLGSNVDAAIAQLRTGTMRDDGAILDIGTISSVVRAPAVGLAVQKSGRTTGHTTGEISATNASVNVQYQARCGGGRRFTVSYTNQIVISSSTFSAGGDSGSLIVTNDSCKQPVGLLFAGSSTTTIANPAGEVITKVGQALGRTVTFVGDSCSSTSSLSTLNILSPDISSEDFKLALTAKTRNEHDLLRLPTVVGVGIGALDTDPSAVAIVVFVDQTTGLRTRLPRKLQGIPVKVVRTDPIVAF